MSKRSYERLSAQDHSFLVMESPTIHMHTGCVNIHEAGPLRTAPGGIDIDLYKRAVASVLHLVPRYRQRLAWVPIENRPVWVDDADFNLDYHIRHTALPRPGSDAQLKRLASRILAQPLDRARPLWEIWVVEGLEGDRFATINKIHHCMIDGLAGVDLAQILFSSTPQYEIQEPHRFVPHAAPSGWDLLRDAVARRAQLPVQIARGVSDLRREAESLRRELTTRVRAVAQLIGMTAQPAPETPVNGPLSAHRRFDWLTMPLAQCKAVSKAFDCTVNDVVLATVAGAVREFLISRRVHPEEIAFRVAAPVSVRQQEDRGRLGNRVSNWFIEIPVAEAKARKRIEAIRRMTQSLKTSQQALGVQMMMAIAEWTPTVVLSLAMRGASAASNIVVTNVPGPQIPIYLLGARLLNLFPGVPLLANQGLGIALISYAGTLCWGFNADYQLVPDIENFVKMIDSSFTELSHAADVDRKHGLRPPGGQAVIELPVTAAARSGTGLRPSATPPHGAGESSGSGGK